MIQLKIHGHNTNGSSVDYTCQNLIFQDFYVGRKRDDINLRVLRRYAEGSILLQDADFDNLKDYFFSQQDAELYINNWNWCILDFVDPNYYSKSVTVIVTFLDQYSLPFDGIMSNSWYNEFYEPLFTKDISVKEIKEHTGILPSAYVDGSQNRYNPGYDNLWYREYLTISADKNVTTSQIFRWNIGGGGVGIEDLTISSLYAKNNYYKPYAIYYTNPSGSTYRHVEITYIREIRYFPDGETVSEEWYDLHSSKTVNNIIYWKFAKFYGGEDQSYFSGKQVYFIKDEHLSYGYITVTYKGYYSELQDSPNFVKLNDLLKYLTYKVFNYGGVALDSDISDSLFIASLKSYNGFENYNDEKFVLSNIVDYLRDRHNVYFCVENIISFKELEFSVKLLDIDDFKNKNHYLNNFVKLEESANIYEYKSKSIKLDFKDINVNFFGTKKIAQPISSAIVTDCEVIEESSDEYMLIDTDIGYYNIINRPFTYIGDPPTYDGGAVKRGEDGSFLTWGISGYLELFSNEISFDYGTSYPSSISYYVKVSYGSVRVQIGSYSAYHTSDGYHSSDFLASGKTKVKVIIDGGGGSAIGEITQLTVSVVGKKPKTQIGLITGIKKKNATLSLPQTIIDNKPLMSYPRGSMDIIGIIDCNTKYSKEINFVIPLDEEIFELDFDKYMGLDGEKWIIFERKRQILTNQNGEAIISKYDKIKCKSNNIY